MKIAALVRRAVWLRRDRGMGRRDGRDGFSRGGGVFRISVRTGSNLPLLRVVVVLQR